VGIVDEATCIRTQGCEPVYSGLGCECTNGYCGCKEFVFTGCRPRDPQPL
jgi:hypothetical protein